MSLVFERLRTALAPGIDLERELASGGMGNIYVGRDTVLDRRVAIKVLKPEYATAVAAERFMREAQSAARLNHPNIVRVYHPGTADGFLYFTMELIAGETLDTRLKRGPLSVAETVTLGRDVLAALGAAHAQSIIHRDVKPSNIFLDNGRAKLGDFGIARVLETDDPTLTTPGKLIGTPTYMSPEQSRGELVTPASDIYSTGLVLFESLTGRRWPAGLSPDEGDWSDVPAGLRRALKRALHLAPAKRWPDAGSFAEALPTGEVEWGAVMMAALALVATVYLVVRFWPSPSPRYDLVLFPFETAGLADTTLGRSVTRATEWHFRRLSSLNLEPRASATRRWFGSSLPPARRLAELTTTTRARFGAWGLVRRAAAGLEVEVSAVNDRGEPVLHAVIEGDAADHVALGDRIGARIFGAISRGLPSSFRRGGAIVHVHPDAALEFLQGEAASERDAWLPAERHYTNALKLDSTFVLAAWRLGNARRWMPLRPTPPFPDGFYPLFLSRAEDLPEVDRRLIEAQFAPSGEPRFAKYDDARRLAPDDPNVLLLYGDELFHRGPLSGRSLEEAARMLEDAVRADSSLAPAWEHLAWALIRLGRREEAARALESLGRVAGRREESEIYLPDFLRLAYTARFEPPALAARGGALLQSRPALALAARGALAFDLPDVELTFGGMLAALEDAPPPSHASGEIAQGVALVTLGRPMAALGAFDSAGALFPDPAEARLQAAEWRVVPAALGVPGVSATEVERGREALASLADRPGGARAAWALAVHTLSRGDTVAGRHWRDVLARQDSAGGPLGLLVAAMIAAGSGDPRQALRLSAPALAYDSAGHAPDPFFRATLHLLRGEWLANIGQPRAADDSWLWYENTDVVGWPETEAQAAEVDWALSTWARVRRGKLASSAGRPGDGCSLIRRALDIWSRPEPATAAVADSLRTSLAACPP